MISFFTTITVLLYDLIISKTSDTVVISWSMIIVILFVSLICLFSDIIRRKLWVDKSLKEILEATDNITKGNFDIKLKLHYYHHKISNLDLIMENINQMADALKHMEVMNTDFINNVSHEIKTPLAIIENYAKALI